MRVVLSLVALLCFAGFNVGATAAKLEKPDVTIAVGGKAALYYLPLSLAEQLGYFEDAGLNVEILDFPGGSKALQAMMGGSGGAVPSCTILFITSSTFLRSLGLFSYSAIVMLFCPSTPERCASPRFLSSSFSSFVGICPAGRNT